MHASGPPHAVGTLLAGRFRLEQPLGRGATAAVWRATDTTLERPVAVKILRDEVDHELRARFEREGRILGALAHPNLVRVLDAGSDDMTPYIVMELVDGRPLHELLAGGPLAVDEAVTVAAQVAGGLAHAHEAGVVHRDIKPSNIVLTGGRVPKVVDFGIARSDSVTTIAQGQSVLGTAMYLSPEQAQGLPVDARSDVYSLGCVLYEMLTGRPPFVGDSAVAIAYRQVHEEPPSPRGLRPDIPAALETVLLRMLAKDPGRRHADATQLAADLQAARHGAAAPAPTAVLSSPEVASALRRPRRRRLWIAALLALLAAITAIAATGAANRDDATTVEVPDVRGLPFGAAQERLGDLGLDVSRTDMAGAATPGIVVEQMPPPGMHVDEGAVVHLTVSIGPPPEDDGDDDKENEEKDGENDDDEKDDDKSGPGNGGRGKGKEG